MSSSTRDCMSDTECLRQTNTAALLDLSGISDTFMSQVCPRSRQVSQNTIQVV